MKLYKKAVAISFTTSNKDVKALANVAERICALAPTGTNNTAELTSGKTVIGSRTVSYKCNVLVYGFPESVSALTSSDTQVNPMGLARSSYGTAYGAYLKDFRVT